MEQTEQEIKRRLPEFPMGKWARARFWTLPQCSSILLLLPVLEERYLNALLNSKSIIHAVNIFKYYPVWEQYEKLKRVHKLVLKAVESDDLKTTQNAEGVMLLRPKDAIEWAKMILGLEIPVSFALSIGVGIPYSPLEEDDILKEDVNITSQEIEEKLERNSKRPAILSIMQQLSDTGLAHPGHCKKKKNEETLGQLKESDSVKPGSMLTPKAQKLFEQVKEVRGAVIDLALQEMYPGEAKSPHLKLIGELSEVDEGEFEKYNKSKTVSLLLERHKCRALGKLLQRLRPDIKIYEIREHPLISKFVWFGKSPKITSETFREWMHEEGVYDHKSKKTH